MPALSILFLASTCRSTNRAGPPLVPSGDAAQIFPSVSTVFSVPSVSPINVHDHPVSLHISFTRIYAASFCFYRVNAILWSIVLDTIYPWLEGCFGKSSACEVQPEDSPLGLRDDKCIVICRNWKKGNLKSFSGKEPSLRQGNRPSIRFSLVNPAPR